MMIRLTLLERLDLVGPDDQHVEAVLRQPKRLALLMYLASGEPGTFRRRDTALLLFWPEATEEQARCALSQTIHFLRRSLDQGVIATRGPGEIAVSPDVLWCDATAFEQAFRRGDLLEALSLYRGDLLPGFSIDAGPEFEQWLDEWRTRLRRQAVAAAWRLSESAERSGDAFTAADWARRAVELSSNDEIAVQRLLRLLDRVGDCAGALDVYARFAARLAHEYRATPSPETKQIIASIRSGSQCARTEPDDSGPIAPLAITAEQRPVASDAWRGPSPVMIGNRKDELPPHAHDEDGALRNGRRKVWFGVIGAAVCSLALWALHGGPPPRHTTESEDTTHIAVATLANLGTPEGAVNFPAALTSAIIDQLARVRALDVLSAPAHGISRSLQPRGSPAPELLLTGGVLQSGERVRVNIQLTDAASGRAVKTAVFEHALGDPLALIDTLSQQIATLVRTAAGHEIELHQWRTWASSERVYELMQEVGEDRDRAGQLERSGDLSTAARALQSADSTLSVVARLAPGWPEPWVERAEASRSLAALYLMPPLRDSTRVQALLRRAIREADRAVSLHPGDPSALGALGSIYYWCWLVAPLPADSAARLLTRAEQNLRSAVTADPNRASTWNLLSATLYVRADYAGAYLAESHAYAADTYLEGSEEILNGLFLTAYEIGDDSAAAHWCDEIRRRFEHHWTSAYCQLALWAWMDQGRAAPVAQAWRTAIEGADSTIQGRQVQPLLHMLVATVLARHGMRDSAEAVIRRARERGSGNPELLPLEADARIALGQRDAAAALLAQYLRAKPRHRFGVGRSRRFATLQSLHSTPDGPSPVPLERRGAR